MSSTQELSQWMLDRNLEQSNNDHTLTYTPGQSGYVGFEDLELGTIENQTQPDITPQIETRIDRFPENKRFTEPETPVPGGKKGIVRNSSDSNDFQTPLLPANPFGNPFGPVLGEENEGIGLTQVFKATQAASSPNLLCRPVLSSSQRPSPNVVARNVFDIPSDIISEPSLGHADLEEITEVLEPSSPVDSISSEPVYDIRKISHVNADGPSSDESDYAVRDQGSKKRKRSDISSGQDGHVDPRLLRSIRRGNTQPATRSSLTEDESNTTEDETEHEVEADDDDIVHRHEDDSEGNKENRAVYHDHPPQPGLEVKRASRRVFTQSIPLSSSPTMVRQQVQLENKDDGQDDAQAQLSSNQQQRQSSAPNEGQHVTIADSQSSQKPNTRQTNRQQIGSSNDSRKVIPQSQAVRPPSSLHIASTARKSTSLESQQTISPPDSSSGRHQFNDAAIDQSQNPAAAVSNTGKLVSPRSSPPLLAKQQEHQLSDDEDEAANEVRDHGEDVTDDVFGGTGLARRLPATLVGRTPATRSTRFASTIPETAYNERHSAVFSASVPVDGGNPFAAAEDMEFRFHGPSQRDQGSNAESRSLAGSFGARRSGELLQSPARKSPPKPRTFQSIGVVESQSQEPDSLELGIWSTQDREMRETILRHSLSGSSPLGAGRKRRRGNNRQPILLDEISNGFGILETTSQSTVQERSPLQRPVADDTTKADPMQLPEQDHVPAPGDQSELNKANASAVEEPIPFVELSLPSRQYGKKANQPKKKREAPSSAPVKEITPIPTLKRGRGRPRKNPIPQVLSNETAQPSTAYSTARSSRKGTLATSYATTRTQQSTAKETTTPSISFNVSPLVVPNRVFAKFRGSFPGYFAATCLACFEDDLEKKYNIRFDDGTTDHLGKSFIKRLEFCIGDEVKVDRRQMKASTFIVKGYGRKLDLNELREDDFPTTDVHGHETIRVVEKLPLQGKKNSKIAQELDIPVTEIFFAAGMWSAVKSRDYIHPISDIEPTHTPIMSKPGSVANSPQSRTRSTNKLNLPGHPAFGPNNQVLNNVSWTVAESGIFKDVAFVFTVVDANERRNLVKNIAREGGTTLDSFDELFEVSEARNLDKDTDDDLENDLQAEQNETNIRQFNGIRLKPKFANTRLAVLVTGCDNRNTKYFQALALGIPCLSLRWIKDCLKSGQLKNWRPYLLAAGESFFLGTECSQQLNLTHKEIGDPDLNLAMLFSRREQWLKDARILIVGSGESGNMTRLEAHKFIALVLGASEVVLSSNTREAEQHLVAAKHNFDWICIDNEKEKEKSSSKSEKKAKRYSAHGIEALQRLKGMEKTKVVGTQLVLESLIVGTLLDWEEMKE